MKAAQSLAFCLITAFASLAWAETYGWRGNWTGLYPDAQPPINWGRQSKGPTEGLRCATSQLPEDQIDRAELVEQGLVTQWLVLGRQPGDLRGAGTGERVQADCQE